jgi:hypothetical protein
LTVIRRQSRMRMGTSLLAVARRPLV